METEKAQQEACPQCGAPAYAGHAPDCPAAQAQDTETVDSQTEGQATDRDLTEKINEQPKAEFSEEDKEAFLKARAEIDRLIDVALQIKIKADELKTSASGIIRRLRLIEDSLDSRDLTTRPLRQLFEQTLSPVSSAIRVLNERADELLAREKNCQKDFDMSKPGEEEANEILNKARRISEEASAEIGRACRAIEGRLGEGAEESKRVVRRTSEYLQKEPDRDSSVYQTARTMQRARDEIGGNCSELGRIVMTK